MQDFTDQSIQETIFKGTLHKGNTFEDFTYQRE